MKVAVIVDDLDPDRRRRCFWEEQLGDLPDVQCDLISLLRQMQERKFFDMYAYDVIIFNWCVLDGTPMYSSDRVQQIVSFYDDHFIQFVRKGGILIMENQPKRWRPVQKAYDVLLPDEVTVGSRSSHFFGSKVLVNPRLRKHPLLRNLDAALHSAYAHSPDESWFPSGSTSQRSLQELQPTKVYSGAFQKWRPDWLPMLYTDDGQFPVMLMKTDGLGLWVVTTMYLASSNIKELVEGLVVGARRHILAVQSFHNRQRVLRRVEVARLAGILVAVAGAIYVILASGVILTDVPYGNTLLGNIVLTLILTALASSLTFLRKHIRNSIRTVLNR